MTWCQCVCGHHRAVHAYVGYEHTSCGHCTQCDRPSADHVFVNHQFQRCPCNAYQETP